MPYLFLALTILLSTAPIAAQADGTFTLRQTSRDGRVNLNFQYEDGHSNYGRTFERSAFSDVKQTGDRITFALRRAPGVFTFEGRGSMERASGWYDFTPSADFQREIERIRNDPRMPPQARAAALEARKRAAQSGQVTRGGRP